ncbi:proline-rich receptor-like protein kinase PERK2 [Iris pallida]|uniref:Proline-rich receptor-like protein kinase PERK2 n=1 Tax=Iris pallida TaxID=29817 RepID=A0AAX6G4S7_IRIPA|nr:proline-rich receptor-like protein kinase PERK2 [Iris pallida]
MDSELFGSGLGFPISFRVFRLCFGNDFCDYIFYINGFFPGLGHLQEFVGAFSSFGLSRK